MAQLPGDDASTDSPKHVLVAAGSNSDGQLGIGHLQDAHTLQRCRCICDVRTPPGDNQQTHFPPAGWKIDELSSGAGHTVCLLSRVQGRHERAQKSVWACGIDKQVTIKSQNNLNNKRSSPTVFTEIDIDAIAKDITALDTNVRWLPKHVAAGWDWTLIALEAAGGSEAIDDQLIVQGSSNDFGQLGIGKIASLEEQTWHVVPIAAALKAERPPSGLLRISALASGVRHSLLAVTIQSMKSNELLQKQYVLAWGAARHGQCGRNFSRSEPTDSIRRLSGRSICWNPSILYAYTGEFRGDCVCDIPTIAVGKDHSLVRVPEHWRARSQDEEGDAHAIELCGSNAKQQLSLDLARHLDRRDLIGLGCMWNSTLLLLRDGEGTMYLLGAGSNSRGQMAHRSDETKGPFLTDLCSLDGTQDVGVQLACGSEHALLRRGNGKVLGWGWNEHGNLAQGDEEDRFEPVSVWPSHAHQGDEITQLADAIAVSVWSGCGTSFIQLLETNK